MKIILEGKLTNFLSDFSSTFKCYFIVAHFESSLDDLDAF